MCFNCRLWTADCVKLFNKTCFSNTLCTTVMNTHSADTSSPVFHTHQLNPFNLQTSLDCAGPRHYTVYPFKWMITDKLSLTNLVLWEHKPPPPRPDFFVMYFFKVKAINYQWWALQIIWATRLINPLKKFLFWNTC